MKKPAEPSPKPRKPTPKPTPKRIIDFKLPMAALSQSTRTSMLAPWAVNSSLSAMR